MENCKITELYNLDETIAKDLLSKYTYPWEVLAHINDFILELGATLPTDEYNKIGDDVWVHKTATVFESAYIHGPAIICKDAEVRHCAFIRGKAIVGEGAVVGNSTELKNVILFNKVQVPHYNYVGDSILGYKSHMGAGSITSNENRRNAWRQRRSWLRECIKPWYCNWKKYKHISAFICKRSSSSKQYL